MGSTGRDLHIDVPLSQIAIAYRPEGMIADMIAPVVSVPKQSDSYYIWNAADAFRTENDQRAPATEPNVITKSISSGTFFCKNYALKDLIPYEDIENADAPELLTARSARSEMLKDKLMLNMEYRVAKQVTSGSNCGSYSAVASAWTDYTNSDPLGNIKTGINNVQDLTGYRPNSIIFGGYAWRHFREHTDVINRMYGYATVPGGRNVSIEQVKTLLEMERVLVGGAYYNSADEGQSASLSQIWFDNVLVYYAPMQARRDKPSFMYAFNWKKIMNMQAFVIDEPKKKAESVELGYYQDEKITASALSFLITGVGSSQ